MLSLQVPLSIHVPLLDTESSNLRKSPTIFIAINKLEKILLAKNVRKKKRTCQFCKKNFEYTRGSHEIYSKLTSGTILKILKLYNPFTRNVPARACFPGCP